VQSNEKTEISFQQEIVDEYLEFLDRRYHRYYNNYEDQDDTIQAKFPFLDWFRQSPNTVKNNNNGVQIKKHAVHILGVADLASKKLILKYKQEGRAYYNGACNDNQNKDKSSLVVKDDGISSSKYSDAISNISRTAVAALLKKKLKRKFPLQNAIRALAILRILLL